MMLQQVPEIVQQPQQFGGQWVYLQPSIAPQAQAAVWGYIQSPQQGMVPQPVQWAQPVVGGPLGFAQAAPAALAPVVSPTARPEFSGDETHRATDAPQTRKGPKNYLRSDERIRELICERLIQDLSIDVADVGIEVQEGRVSVSGSVPQRHMKHAIEDVIDGCWGVRGVDNDLRVQASLDQQAAATTFISGQAQAGGGFANR